MNNFKVKDLFTIREESILETNFEESISTISLKTEISLRKAIQEMLKYEDLHYEDNKIYLSNYSKVKPIYFNGNYENKEEVLDCLEKVFRDVKKGNIENSLFIANLIGSLSMDELELYKCYELDLIEYIMYSMNCDEFF